MSTETPFNPVYIGPTWKRDPDHPSGWHLPKLSLGWHIVTWQDGRLQHETNKPWRYTPEQLRFILWWYAVDENLRFLYGPDGVLQRLKGWGKDPLGATVCATEFIGPSRPDPAGRTVLDPWGNEHPAGVPHPAAWVQVVAVAKEQTKNTMTLFPSLFTKAAIEEYQIDLGKEIIYAHRGAKRLEAVTSSPRTLEGPRSTFVLKNETQHWLENNEGHAMESVIRRNVAKSKDGNARSLAITNAYEPSEDSVAQVAREAWEKMEAGSAVRTRLLYDSVEAPPEAPLSAEAAPDVIKAIRGDSDWLSIDGVIEEILDVRNPPSQSRRWWYNQITAAEDAVFSPQEWDAATDPEFIPQPGDVVTLGFDGSLADDHTALIGCHVEQDFLFEIGVWAPPIDRGAIDRAVRAAFETYDVVGFYADLHPWESYVDAWAADLSDDLVVKATARQPVAWDMRSRQQQFTIAVERFVAAILGGEEGARLTHDGSKRFRMHALNARRAPNKWGFTIRKESRESPKKIDAVAAAVLARLARMDYVSLPESRRRRQRGGKVW